MAAAKRLGGPAVGRGSACRRGRIAAAARASGLTGGPITLRRTKSTASTAYSQGNTVCLIPKQLLEPGRSYQAHVQGTVDGQARNWDWRFSTPAVPAATDPLDKAAMGATIGKLAAIEGQVLGAGTLDDGTVYLNFSPDLDPSAFFPKDVWAKLGLGDPAKALEGKRVRLVCTPRRQTKGDVELDISDPRWFKLL